MVLIIKRIIGSLCYWLFYEDKLNEMICEIIREGLEIVCKKGNKIGLIVKSKIIKNSLSFLNKSCMLNS